jgi:hypothetical protein
MNVQQRWDLYQAFREEGRQIDRIVPLTRPIPREL